MEVRRVEKGDGLWEALIGYAKRCSWEAGAHLASMMERNAFEDWESVFAAVESGDIAGFCTFLKADYYPENRYSPWISSVFVGERHRGRRLSGQMIEYAVRSARERGFSKVYIPSDRLGFYERYGFVRIDELQNYAGEIDYIFEKAI